MSMKDWKGIIALAVVTVLAVGLIWGTTVLTGGGSREEAKETEQTTAAGKTEELAVEGYEGIQKAVRKVSGDGQVEGYEITVSTEGYQGPILMTAYLDGSGSRLNRLEMLEQQETENLGGKIAEADFLKQFQDIALPVSLARPGEKKENVNQKTQMSAVNTTKTTDEESRPSGTVQKGEMALGWTGLRDGTYEARAEGYSGGFLDFVVMTVSRGRVTELVWDAVDEEGNSKRVLADNGEYMMTDYGLTWSQQADALAKEVLSRQSLEFLAPDTAGKIDGIAGVSISVTPFMELVRQCLIQAGAQPGENPENLPSQESGAWESTGPERETGTDQGETQDTEQSSERGDSISPISDDFAQQETGMKSQVDGISGATVSSAAVVQGVNQAYEYVQDKAEMTAR